MKREMRRKEERWEKEREELKERIEYLENWRREGGRVGGQRLEIWKKE